MSEPRHEHSGLLDAALGELATIRGDQEARRRKAEAAIRRREAALQREHERLAAVNACLIRALELFKEHEGESELLDAVAGELAGLLERKLAVPEASEAHEEEEEPA